MFVYRNFIVTTVKELLKLIHVWQSYVRNKKGTVFLPHSVVVIVTAVCEFVCLCVFQSSNLRIKTKLEKVCCVVIPLFLHLLLSIPVQSIALKDSSLKWHIMCWVRCQTLLTHSCICYKVLPVGFNVIFILFYFHSCTDFLIAVVIILKD